MSSRLPDSVRFALWFSAWASGAASLDDARDAVVGDDADHHVVGGPGADEAVPLIVGLGRLRSAGATAAGIALPVPGDPLGLGGPTEFNGRVLEVGEGVVLDGTDLGMVPHRAGSGVVWSVHRAASRRQVPDPSEADTALRRAVLDAAGTLADLDVARWRPELADALMDLRRKADLGFPHGMSPRASSLAALAVRCRSIVDLAVVDDGAAITAAQADRRRNALVPLDHAARRGLVAACAFPFER